MAAQAEAEAEAQAQAEAEAEAQAEAGAQAEAEAASFGAATPPIVLPVKPARRTGLASLGRAPSWVAFLGMRARQVSASRKTLVLAARMRIARLLVGATSA